MEINIKEVLGYAKFQVDESKMEDFTKSLSALKSMADDLSGFEGEIPALDYRDAMPLRPDVVVPSPGRDVIFANAPEKKAGCFIVPPGKHSAN